MRKLISVIMTTILILTLSTNTWAAGAGSVTIDNAVIGETYTIYRLLELESYNEDLGAYAYKANPAWEGWLRTQTDYLSFDETGYVTWVPGADAAAFAKLAQAWAATSGIENQGSQTATSAQLVFAELALGYYLVDTTMGTLCSLDTAKPNVTIREKNKAPLIDKEVEEDSTDAYGKTNDADLGQTVYFRTTITAMQGAQSYVVHDTMSAGLTLSRDSLAVAHVSGTEAPVTLTEGNEYQILWDRECTGKDGTPAVCDFHIIFAQSFLDTLKDNDVLIITYAALLNGDAVVGLPGNPNDTALQFSEDNWTEWAETNTYTWDLDVFKYGNGDRKMALSGAEFVLLNKDKSAVAIFNGGLLAGWEALPAEGEAWPDGAVLVTGADGKICADGLDADLYYLREIKAPDGFNRLPNDIEIEIVGAVKGEGDTLSYETIVKEINNQSGTLLPETGAAGTKVFLAGGSFAILSAVIFMVTRKKMSIYEEG